MTEGDRLRGILNRIARRLGPGRIEILVFGSGALALGVLPEHRSQDIDLASDSDEERLREVVNAIGLGKTKEKREAGEFYVEVTPWYVFKGSAPYRWHRRAKRVELPEGHRAIVPDALDILVAKTPRYAPKDREDIAQVFAEIGLPPREEMLGRFREAVLMYRPSFDEWTEYAGDPFGNTKRFFEEFYGEKIDVRKEIVIPGIAGMKEDLGVDRVLPLPPMPRPPMRRKKR